MNSVTCPHPIRPRRDDQLVEVFLHAYENGRFSHKLEWLPQHVTNVEILASTEDNVTAAIEHTKLFEYLIGRHTNPEEDPLIGEVVGHLADMSLSVSDRTYMLSVDPKNLKEAAFRQAASEDAGKANLLAQRMPACFIRQSRIQDSDSRDTET